VSRTDTADARYMTRALELAARGLGRTYPNPPVGAVLVRDGRIIGEGFHHRAGAPHAEVEALRAAKGRARGATLYVTLEPCAMCASAMVHARIARLVYGADDPKAGAAGSVFDIVRSERLNHRIDCAGGVLAEECGTMLTRFFAERR